ncbi:hypothetical protein [Pseudomonas putida]
MSTTTISNAVGKLERGSGDRLRSGSSQRGSGAQ